MIDSVVQKPSGATPELQVARALGARSVVLVGMMGAGKSSVGRRLGARLGIPFVDADTEIETAAGMSISEIFAQHGESYFRAGEARVIARLLAHGPQVVATGAWMYCIVSYTASMEGRSPPSQLMYRLTSRSGLSASRCSS